MIPFSPRMGATLTALVVAGLAIRLLSQLVAGHTVQCLRWLQKYRRPY